MTFLRSLLPCYVLHHLPSLIPNHFTLPSCLRLPPTSFLLLSLLVLPSLSLLPLPLYRLQFSFLSFPPSFAVSCLSSSSQGPKPLLLTCPLPLCPPNPLLPYPFPLLPASSYAPLYPPASPFLLFSHLLSPSPFFSLLHAPAVYFYSYLTLPPPGRQDLTALLPDRIAAAPLKTDLQLNIEYLSHHYLSHSL
ncbi:hypothetical protein K443DRAFT_680650 [Laccaria amethystina LaAM-08-1]|uniref:Uncharacterized protein n=1 Tax=Laccaria amethystina LaAM-08-1 TaxID=1095629 RepID=A0A0C9XRR0_9AGAR|nr:hypothetical protein K443DRAFT_680650 [Laccaria amethystina LaAM-08-1]